MPDGTLEGVDGDGKTIRQLQNGNVEVLKKVSILGISHNKWELLMTAQQRRQRRNEAQEKWHQQEQAEENREYHQKMLAIQEEQLRQMRMRNFMQAVPPPTMTNCNPAIGGGVSCTSW